MKNICDWNNCNEIGEYKAPVEKDNSKKFRLLCLNHVKEFNKNWNYFSGMNDDQVIDFLKSDMVWHKPTQSFSSSDNFFKVLWNNTLKDELDKDKFKKGVKLTFVGTLEGTERLPLHQTFYNYLVLKPVEYHVWSKKQQRGFQPGFQFGVGVSGSI